MANHTHVVITDCPNNGSDVRRVLKGVSQAALSRMQARPQRWWTQRGSNRYLHGSEAIEAAVSYVAEQQRILAEIVDGAIRPRTSST